MFPRYNLQVFLICLFYAGIWPSLCAEMTCAILKPDLVASGHIGEAINALEKNGFTMRYTQRMRLTQEQAEAFYAEHKEKPFFQELVTFMTSGPIWVMGLEKDHAIADWRTLIGKTNPAQAAEGTLRKQFGTSATCNAFHGSDSRESAQRELSFFFPEYAKKLAEETRKKKIVIMYSRGGGAHISARNALDGYFKESYDIVSTNPICDILHHYDPVRRFTFSWCTGEDLYNGLLLSQQIWLTNTIADLAISSIYRNKRCMERRILRYLMHEKPDLVISVMPFLNLVIAEACAQLNIPFLLVSPDLELSYYVPYFNESEARNTMYMTVPFDDEHARKTIANGHINPHHVFVSHGLPLRKEFFTPKDPAATRAEFNLPDDKPIVMLLMGAAGSTKIIQYLKRMRKNKTPFHLVVCIGRNEKMRKRIKRIRFPDTISISVVGFTTKIADLLSTTDVLITKPGLSSIAEAVQMRVPLLIDDCSGSLRWEKRNIEFVTENGLGYCIYTFHDINTRLSELLENKDLRESIKQKMLAFSGERFEPTIRTLITDLIAEKELSSCPQ